MKRSDALRRFLILDDLCLAVAGMGGSSCSFRALLESNLARSH